MRIPIYRSRQTSYQLRPGRDCLTWGVTSVESFEPIALSVVTRGELRVVTAGCDEPVAVVQAPEGTKLVTLEVPGSPVNPLIFAEIPDPKGKLPYLARELPGTLLAAAKNRVNGCELVADALVVEAPPEIDRSVVVVPPAVESRETPQVCEANQGSSDDADHHSVAAQRIEAALHAVEGSNRLEAAVEAIAELDADMEESGIKVTGLREWAIRQFEEVLADTPDGDAQVERFRSALTANQQKAERRIAERLERARQAAWQEHQALARPSSPKPGRKRVAADQGSLFF